jgi:hypothetical protein
MLKKAEYVWNNQGSYRMAMESVIVYFLEDFAFLFTRSSFSTIGTAKTLTTCGSFPRITSESWHHLIHDSNAFLRVQ